MLPKHASLLLQAGSSAELVTVEPGQERLWVDGKVFDSEMERLQSWDWIYASSPKFSVPLSTGDVSAVFDKGCFVGLTTESEGDLSPGLQQLVEVLRGVPCKETEWSAALFALRAQSETWGDLEKAIYAAMLGLSIRF